MTNANSHYMTSSTSMGQMSSANSAHVTNNGKIHNELRQSPGVMRRQLSLINNHHPSTNHSQNSHVIIFWFFSLIRFHAFEFLHLSYQKDNCLCLCLRFWSILISNNEESLAIFHDMRYISPLYFVNTSRASLTVRSRQRQNLRRKETPACFQFMAQRQATELTRVVISLER